MGRGKPGGAAAASATARPHPGLEPGEDTDQAERGRTETMPDRSAAALSPCPVIPDAAKPRSGTSVSMRGDRSRLSRSSAGMTAFRLRLIHPRPARPYHGRRRSDGRACSRQALTTDRRGGWPPAPGVPPMRAGSLLQMKLNGDTGRTRPRVRTALPGQATHCPKTLSGPNGPSAPLPYLRGETRRGYWCVVNAKTPKFPRTEQQWLLHDVTFWDVDWTEFRRLLPAVWAVEAVEGAVEAVVEKRCSSWSNATS